MLPDKEKGQGKQTTQESQRNPIEPQGNTQAPEQSADLDIKRKEWLEGGPTQVDATEPESIWNKLASGRLHLTHDH